ncbi:MAG: DUF169 domain-containing protein [Deltaproteobacteria bacterium]|nr:DUF169 domain-containing protein [Deltaproteobacteria bacterium]
MESTIAQAVGLTYPPVALLWADRVPEGAVQFKEGRWGCLMWLVASAAEGKVAACDRKTFGCAGGGVGFGFGEQYRQFPGGVDCFCRFLSSGNEGCAEGRAAAEQVRPHLREEAFEEFLHGERYFRTPELARRFVESLPVADIPAEAVVLKPLAAVDPGREEPQVVVLLADPNQLSALVILANYGRGYNENVIVPFAAGCQSIGLYPYREGRSETPRAVMGLVDLSARLQLKPRMGDNLFSFAVPYRMFQEMEADVPGSFLDRPTWKKLTGRGD